MSVFMTDQKNLRSNGREVVELVGVFALVLACLAVMVLA